MIHAAGKFAQRSVLVAVLAATTAACLYVPPVWDISDPNNKVDSIRLGETTRNEVLALLGATPSVCEGSSPQNSKWYYYSGTYSAGQLAYVGDQKSLGETRWYLNIFFGDNNVVEYVDTNPPQAERPQISALPLEEAEAIAKGAPPPELFVDRSCANP